MSLIRKEEYHKKTELKYRIIKNYIEYYNNYRY